MLFCPSPWHPEHVQSTAQHGKARCLTVLESVFAGSADLLDVDSPAEKRFPSAVHGLPLFAGPFPLVRKTLGTADPSGVGRWVA